MSSAPATLEQQGLSLAAPPSYSWPTGPLGESAVLDSAASVWATFKYARTIPAAPETQREMRNAEQAFLDQLSKSGLTVLQIEHRIREIAHNSISRRNGRPPGAS